MSVGIDRDFLAQWIGREEQACDVLTPSLAARFHASLDQPGSAPVVGEAAHPLIHFCLAQPVAETAGLGEDGHIAKGGFLPPVPLPRRMWAASEMTFNRELRVGETVSRLSRIVDLKVKEGRSGVLCFVDVAHHWSVDGEAAVEENQTIVYREADTGIAPVTPSGEPAPEGAISRTVQATPPLLFRYSALTFNSHRIHYDRAYATQVENYPGLVVHGPLQATLLMSLALEAAGGARPVRFKFRGNTPAFDLAPLCLHADSIEDGRLRLWSSRPEGPVALSAEAVWA